MLSAFSQRWCGVAGKQDDGNVSRSRVTLEILNQLPSITGTQRQVRHDDVRVKTPSPAVGLFAIGGLDCLETERGKTMDVKFTRVVVIVDDEYQRLRRNVARATAVHGFESP